MSRSCGCFKVSTDIRTDIRTFSTSVRISVSKFLAILTTNQPNLDVMSLPTICMPMQQETHTVHIANANGLLEHKRLLQQSYEHAMSNHTIHLFPVQQTQHVQGKRDAYFKTILGGLLPSACMSSVASSFAFAPPPTSTLLALPNSWALSVAGLGQQPW